MFDGYYLYKVHAPPATRNRAAIEPQSERLDDPSAASSQETLRENPSPGRRPCLEAAADDPYLLFIFGLFVHTLRPEAS
jgi:hypothetical protein